MSFSSSAAALRRFADILPCRSEVGVVGHAVRQVSGRTLLARRTLIASAAGTLAFAPRIGRLRAQVAPVASDQTADALFRELDERIEAAMARYHVPGVAVGCLLAGSSAQRYRGC
jgi:hypothetical protein